MTLDFVTTVIDGRRVTPELPFPPQLEVQYLSTEGNELEIIAGVLDHRARYLRGQQLESLRVSASRPYYESEPV